jgi:phosphatidylglycerophosphate synthase
MIASSLFIYQTLDAIDGKQARRTKQSSPLGQLFDHGNDALILTPMLICSFCATQAGRTWQFITFMMLAYSVFFMLNWRARHVGMMHFGVFSVTESQFIAIVVQILTGILGCDIWSSKIFNLIDGKDAVMGFFLIMGVYTNISEYYAVQRYYSDNPNRRDPGQIHELLHLILFITALFLALTNLFNFFILN